MVNYTKDQIDTIVNKISNEISIDNIADKQIDSAQKTFQNDKTALDHAMKIIPSTISIEYTKEFITKMFYELLCEDN